MLTRRRGLGLTAAVAVILASVRSSGFAAPPDKACSLLTASEITAQVGAPGEGKESELPATQGSAGEPTKMCAWTVAGGAVRLTFAHAADVATARQTFRAKMQSSIDALKTRGWTVDQKSFGENAACWAAAPPANAGSAPHTTGCAGVTNNLGLSVSTTGTTTVEIEKVKKLLDAAMGRLH